MTRQRDRREGLSEVASDGRDAADLRDLPLRRLLHRLAATEEALARLTVGNRTGPPLDAERRAVLRRQAVLVRELRSRRRASRRLAGAARQASGTRSPVPW